MRKRRKAREAVLQILYQKDMTDDQSSQVPKEFWEQNPCDEEVMEFANMLVKGTLEQIEEIDSIIEKSSDHWIVSRMGVVDRNILRLAVHEMTSGYDIPMKVTLDEAIDISKKFGTNESSKFINGVLDKIKKDIESNPELFGMGERRD